MQFVVELSTQKITYLYLRNIVHYKLIVEEWTSKVCWNSWAHWNNYSVLELLNFLRIWCWPAHSLGWMFSRRQVTCIEISMHFLIHFSESHFAQQKDSCAIFSWGKAIIGWFWRHVCKIHTLSKHIPRYWCLRRSYPQPLTQNTHKIGQPTSMPKQCLIMDVLGKPYIFLITAEGKQINQFQRIWSMSLGMCTL